MKRQMLSGLRHDARPLRGPLVSGAAEQEIQDTASANGVTALRVVKKLSPHQRGAMTLTKLYGDSLVCVRHRQDAAGAFRYTTVELLIEHHPIAARNAKPVGVRIDFRETRLRQTIRAHGGQWDSQHRVWVIPRKIAAKLDLQDRIVNT